MNKSDRLNVIRAVYLAKAGGMAYRGPKDAPMQPEPPKKVTRLVIGWPEIKPDTKRAPRWFMEAADSAREWRPKFRQGPHELTRIAAKWRPDNR